MPETVLWVYLQAAWIRAYLLLLSFRNFQKNLKFYDCKTPVIINKIRYDEIENLCVSSTDHKTVSSMQGSARAFQILLCSIFFFLTQLYREFSLGRVVRIIVVS